MRSTPSERFPVPSDPDFEARLRDGLRPELDPRNHFDSVGAFEDFMRQVDSDMQAEGVPIVSRELEGARQTAMCLETTVYGVPPDLAKPGDYSNLSLSAHVTKWFRERYGSRLTIDLTGGSTVVSVLGDFYPVDIPFVLGRPRFVFDATLRDRNADVVHRAINIARLVEGLTETTAGRLDELSRAQIVARVAKGVALGQMLNNLRNQHYLKEAMGDLRQAVALVFGQPSLTAELGTKREKGHVYSTLNDNLPGNNSVRQPTELACRQISSSASAALPFSF